MIPVVETGFHSEGQILFGSQYVAGYVTPKVLEDYKLILIENFCHMGCFSWHILNSIFLIPNIEDIRNEVKYRCPWSKNEYYWWFPQWLLTKDPVLYRSYIDGNKPPEEQAAADHWWDDEYLRNFLDKSMSGSYLELSRIARAFLGHGFTDHNLPMEGHGAVKEHVVMLENGDLLAGHGWEWFSNE